MDHIAKELKTDYDLWVSKIGDEPYVGKGIVGIGDVLRAHYLVIDYFLSEFGEGIGGFGPRDINLLHSAMSRQFTGYSGKSKWNSDFEVCATLFYGLIKNHPFHDVNKRTAFLTLLYQLRRINRTPNTRQKDFEILAIRIASNELDKYTSFNQYKNKPDKEVLFIADFLRKNTRTIDKNEYIITYRDLNTILHRFNYGLMNQEKNRIDLIHFEDEYKGFLRREKRTIQKRINSIDFPGWGRQVCIREIKRIRKLTYLTHEDGVDSDEFFHNAEPFSALIWQFQGPLKRLADK